MRYDSQADMVRLLAEWYDTKSNVKLGGFQSQLQASYVSSHTEEVWYSKSLSGWLYNISCSKSCKPWPDFRFVIHPLTFVYASPT